MAKKPLPVPEFDPVKKIEPSQGITSFYHAPRMDLKLPEGNLSQLATALQVLSPSIGKYIDKQAETQNKEEAAQGLLDAQDMTPEERRDFLAGKFAKLELAGVIPEGASPFRMVAMQEYLGRDLVRNGLATTLTNNIAKMSQPGVEADTGAFVQSEYEKLGIQNLNFYAQQAAMKEREGVERSFRTQVDQRKAARTTKTNKENLTSDYTHGFSKWVEAKDDEAKEIWASYLKGLGQNAFSMYGVSGAEELLNSLTSVAQNTAEESGAEAALLLIDEFKESMVGKSTLNSRFRMELGDLENSVVRIADAAEARQERSKTVSSADLTKKINIASGSIWVGWSTEAWGKDLKDPTVVADVKQQLEESGIKDENIPYALTKILDTFMMRQNREEEDEEAEAGGRLRSDPEARRLVVREIYNKKSTKTPDQLIKLVNDNWELLSAVDYERFMKVANESKTVGEKEDAEFRELNSAIYQNQATAAQRNIINKGLGAAFGDKPMVLGDALAKYNEIDQAVRTEVAAMTNLTTTEKAAEHLKQMKEKAADPLAKAHQAIITLNGGDALEVDKLKVLREELKEFPGLMETIEDLQRSEVERAKPTAEGKPGTFDRDIETSFWFSDYDATSHVENLNDKDPEVSGKARGRLNTSILKAFKKAKSGDWKNVPRDKKALTVFAGMYGVTLEGLKKRESQQVEGLKFDDDTFLNPKLTVFIPRGARKIKGETVDPAESIQGFQKWGTTDEAEKYIREVIKNLPDMYRTSYSTGPNGSITDKDVELFLEAQESAMLKYRHRPNVDRYESEWKGAPQRKGFGGG